MLVKSKKKRKIIANVFFYVIATIWVLILNIPFLWMVLGAFKTIDEIVADPIVIFPQKWMFRNFVDLFERVDFFRMFLNTAVISVGGMIATVCGSTIVAYGFARFEFRYKNIFFGALLSTMMLPWVVTTIPIYVVFAKIGWINTYFPFILPNLGGNAVYIFMLRQFIKGLRRELDEAAILDGCGRMGILIKILVPLMLPAIATICIFCFVNGWADIVGPSIYLRVEKMYTLSQGMYILSNPINSRIQWQLCMAFGVLFTIPMFIVFFAAQKVFISGIALGGVKD